jgi:hypothetical protein
VIEGRQIVGSSEPAPGVQSQSSGERRHSRSTQNGLSRGLIFTSRVSVRSSPCDAEPRGQYTGLVSFGFVYLHPMIDGNGRIALIPSALTHDSQSREIHLHPLSTQKAILESPLNHDSKCARRRILDDVPVGLRIERGRIQRVGQIPAKRGNAPAFIVNGPSLAHSRCHTVASTTTMGMTAP